ncbi:hypothetical protein APU90_05965 [Rathayibacter toxicus]|nr:hypothetical protein APU90_05965 [Rathayibacter toxicus]
MPGSLKDLPYGDISYHSVSHLMSALLMDTTQFYEGITLGLAMDFAPDQALETEAQPNWYAGAVVTNGAAAYFPIESPGAIYCAARDRFAMREGTLMALATATKAHTEFDIAELDTELWFGRRGMLARADRIIETLYDASDALVEADPRFSEQENRISAVMKGVQELSFRIAQRNVNKAVDDFGLDLSRTTLALAGGSVLNCPVNSRLIEANKFFSLMAPPSVADDGQSVGIALEHFLRLSESNLAFQYPGPYLGVIPDPADLEREFSVFSEHIRAVSLFDTETAVSDLIEGPIVWVDGRSEAGPRALGHRSILADPRSDASKDQLNKLKDREWWRPVAPIVLYEEASGWFENLRLSPFMLETFTLATAVTERVPAVAHLDATARVQTIGGGPHDGLRDLVGAFFKRTGVPMVCNTSLNDAGEPIIESVRDALNFALRKQLSVAYVHGTRIELIVDRSYSGYTPGARSGYWQRRDEDCRYPEFNLHLLTEVEIYILLRALPIEQVLDGSYLRLTRETCIEIIEHAVASDPNIHRQAASAIAKNKVLFEAFGNHPLVPEPRFTSSDNHEAQSASRVSIPVRDASI